MKRALLIAACLIALRFPPSKCMADTTVTQVAGGFDHCLFILSDGSLWGMGNNGSGQLGLGFGLSQTLYPQLIVASNVTGIAAGDSHSLFVESNGSLWAMGFNAEGQLGDGTNVNHYFPEQIVASGVQRGVAAGANHSMFTTFGGAPLASQALWVMGINGNGQLGDGTMTFRETPEKIYSTVVALTRIGSMSGGYQFSLHTRDDGSLWATGANDHGQLGDSTTNQQLSYEAIVSSNVTAVAAGEIHSLFLKSDGGLWAMGDNSFGELGDNSKIEKHSPEQVGVNVIAIAAGFDFSLFIKSDNTLWGMGSSGNGELGIGTNMFESLVPVQIASNVVAVAASDYSSYFIKSDGTLWGMGENVDGNLGDGTFATRYSPVQLVPLVVPQPVITGVSLANTNIVLSGTNGESGRTYYTLMSTDVTRPLNQWTPVATNLLFTDGAFTFTATNAVPPNAPQAFYILQTQ